MNIDKISVGDNPPDEVNVIIEVAAGTDPVKYEMDKDSGALLVDRIVATAMYYPANYGFIPHTLGGDGDPIDVLVACNLPFLPGSVVSARPVGVLMMEDEKGADEKIIAVPAQGLNSIYDNVNDVAELPKILCDQIAHFFEHYKDLEKGKWVKVTGWEGKEKAVQLINESIERAGK